ncbi:MAG TPA: hypothetical protein VN948_00100 [Terriglobales bacterium]|nr:hypothetical protein [Terriglobales bacterium]
MTDCAERDELLVQKDAAWREYYDLQSSITKGEGLESAEKKVHHLMRALTAHYRKHGCNKTVEKSK